MKKPGLIAQIAQNENLNFLLTNRIPRIQLTRFMGWFSKIENPIVRDCSMAVWRLFTELNLSEAKQTEFKSLHDCFTRELREGARLVDRTAHVLTSPCDAIVGAFGKVRDAQAFQAKGFPYRIEELFGDRKAALRYQDGIYVTLRLTAGMYHRFHAVHDCLVDQITYISGDTWNVNPIALKRIERLFCKNERVRLRVQLLAGGQEISLIAVAAVLVASVRLKHLEAPLNLRYRGPNVFAYSRVFRKGEEIGWFEHGSTILVFAPSGFDWIASLREGQSILMGEPLLQQR
jgi:phosphatidylserine decarboxylase